MPPLRAALVGTIYHKTLRLTSVAAREVGQGAATTFMSVDVEKICMVLEFVHEICESGRSLSRSGPGLLSPSLETWLMLLLVA